MKHYVYLLKESRKPGFMYFDTGCKRCVSGPDDHVKMTAALALIGLQPVRKDKKEQFIFGDGIVEESECSYIYPAFIRGQYVTGGINIAKVNVPCPPLFSIGMAAQWECITNHKKKYVRIGRFRHKVPFKDGVTPYIDVFEYGPGTDMTVVPREFFIE
jgi:hypothetical protein